MIDSPFKLPLTIEKGATFDNLCTWQTQEDKCVVTPVDLTACQALLQARSTVESDVVLLEMSTLNGKIILGGATGTIQLLLTDEETAAIDWETAGYDLFITFSNGYRRKLYTGPINVVPSYTRVTP